MRIILIHRYFWPDTPPYAHILREIAVRLGEAGHQVTVLTCQPSYNRSVVGRAAAWERLSENVQVRRWPVLPDRRFAALKALNLVWFCVRVLLARRSVGPAQVVMAASAPPIAMAMAGRLLARRSGARFVYHKQDIYPEVVTAPGILPHGRRSAALRWLDTTTERAAARVVVLSDDMARTVEERGVDTSKIAVINNFDPWQIDAGDADADDDVPNATGDFHVVFAGNLGRFQNLETVIAIARELRSEKEIAFDFIGDGALRGTLEDYVARHELRNVRLHGYLPPAELARFLRTEADLGVVSLMPGVIRAAYPSKTMSYLRQGCPVLALVEADSALAQAVESSGAGFHADPTDAAAAAKLIGQLAGRRAELGDARKRARELYAAEFAYDRQLTRWAELFEAVGGIG